MGVWRASFLSKSERLRNDADFSSFSPILSTETVDNFSAIAARQRNRYDSGKPPVPNFQADLQASYAHGQVVDVNYLDHFCAAYPAKHFFNRCHPV